MGETQLQLFYFCMQEIFFLKTFALNSMKLDVGSRGVDE